MSKVTTLSQLRATAQRANAAISEVAGDAADAIEALDAAKADAPTWRTVSLTVASWTTNTVTAVKNAGYNYMASITVNGITAADSAECIIAPADMPTAVAAGICPTTDVIAGAIRFYAQKAPTAAISLQVRPIVDTSIS